MNGHEIANRVSQRLSEKYGESLSPTFVYAQMAHETGGFKSELATKYHNYGGVTQTTPNGLDQPDGSNYYMNFGSDEDFADYFADYLYKYKEDGVFNAHDTRSYATALKNGGYFGDDVENYVAGMNNFIGTNSIGEFVEGAYEASNPVAPVVEQKETEEADTWDKLEDTLYDSAIWGAFRTAAAKKDLPDEEGYKLNQEDIDRVQQELGDYSATLWVCQNANSPAQLDRLIRMKKQDLERRQRVDESDIGFSTAGTVLGLFLDPINYLPVLGAAGKLGSVARYAKLAAGTAVGNIADRGLAQAASGYRQDYPMAALMGAVGGAGIPMALDLMGKGFSKASKSVGAQLYGETTNIVDDAARLAKGERVSLERINNDDFINTLTKVHDTDFVKGVKDAEIAGQIRPKSNVYVLSKEDAKKVVEGRGWDFDDNAKGFFDDETGVTVLIKDNLSGNEDIRKTLLHERGAHGLKFVLSENDYNKVIADLRFRINTNPSPAMQRAIKRAGGNADAEEVLGYLAEEMKPSNPLMRKIHKAMDKSLNAMGFKGRLSDDDFIDILTKGSKHYAEGQKGYRVLSDGAVEYKGLHYSKKNLFNPENMTMAAKLSQLKEDTKDFAVGGFESLLKRTKLFATPYSQCSTSQSKTLRGLNEKLIASPYMETKSADIPAEIYKDNMRFQADHMLNNYFQKRNESLVRLQKFSADAKYDYNEAVVKAYNAKHAGNMAAYTGDEFPPEVLAGVAEIEKMRNYLLELLVDPQRKLGAGYGLMDENGWQALDSEFFRWIDNSKHADFLASFKNKQEAATELTKYCKKYGKKDIVRNQIEKERQRKWAQAAEEAKAKGEPIPEKPEALSDDAFMAEYEKRAEDCARGWVDLGASDVTANVNLDEIGTLGCLRYRFPLDTSGSLELSNGNLFSFDDNLRSFDIDTYMGALANRIAGEVSLTTVFPKDAKTIFANPLGFTQKVNYDLEGQRRVVKAELEDAVQRRQITVGDMTDDLKAFDFMTSKLRGFPTSEYPQTLWDAGARTLNNYAFARNSGNMVLNQLGEVGGTIGYAGIRALFDLFPYAKRMVTEAQLGKASVDMVEEARLATFGDEGYKYIFGNANDSASRVYRDLLNNTRKGQALDKVAGLANTSASAMSKITGFQKLTENMIQSAQRLSMIDMARWVNGKEFTGWQNPFSTKKMEAAGLVYGNSVSDFRNALKKYVVLDKQGNLTSFDVKALRKENPDLYMQYYRVLENQVRRCINMPSIGSSNMLKESGAGWRVFFMFKDFVMRSVHTQTLRAISSREADDALAAGFSLLTNLAVVLAPAYLRSKYIMNKDNKNAHDKYMKEYLDPMSLGYVALMRSPYTGSALSPIGDVLEMTDNAPVPSIRTTTNRYRRNKNTDEVLGSYITQLPAVKSGTDLVYTPAKFGAKAFTNDRYTRRDFEELFRLLPGQNHLLMMKLRDELLGATNLPKK